MKFAHIDENNMLLGFYDDDVHEEIPSPNVEVTEEQWEKLLEDGCNKVNPDGTGEVVDTRTQEEITEWENSEYQRNRRKEYPSIGDQLDALFHAGVFPEEMAAQIQAVKDAHPKPTTEGA